MDHIYDVIILGAGPAGLSAGLYAGRSRLDTLIIEKGQAGGQIINTDEIENYPGQIVEGETGVSLVRRMYEQAEQFGAEHVRDTITNAELSGDIKVLTGEKDTYQAKNIIIATGAYARPIGCKGEQEYKGRGISYCATCDANFFTDLEVYVAGGGDAAVEEALYLTKFARKVTIIHRRDELRAAKSIPGESICQSEDHISVGFGSRRSGRRRTASDDDCEECEDGRTYKDRSRSERRTVRTVWIHRYDPEYRRVCR